MSEKKHFISGVSISIIALCVAGAYIGGDAGATAIMGGMIVLIMLWIFVGFMVLA